jgi:hypothetical protein
MTRHRSAFLEVERHGLCGKPATMGVIELTTAGIVQSGQRSLDCVRLDCSRQAGGTFWVREAQQTWANTRAA